MMKPATILLLALAAFSAAPVQRTFTGTISDDMCAIGGHARMQMGPTDAECTRACVALHGAGYVLISGKSIYVLSGQTTPEQLAGQRVKVVGMLDAKTKTIRVRSLTAAPRR